MTDLCGHDQSERKTEYKYFASLLHLQCLVVASSTHIALSENFFPNVFSAFCLDWITVFEVSCFPIFSCRAVLIGKLTALSSRNVCEMPRLLFVISFSFF